MSLPWVAPAIDRSDIPLMAYCELVLRVSDGGLEQLEAALESAGALSVTVLDADAGTDREQPMLEPGVGETPLWSAVELHALFDANVDADRVMRVCSDATGMDLSTTGAWREVPDQAWERVWMEDFKPMQFGARIFIVPGEHELPAAARAPDAAVVLLDPGLAFGTGTHPTTALCLEWLDSLDLRGGSVVDVGCGSGILAIAALKLGAARAVGIDHDPQALLASRDNAIRNDVADRLELIAAGATPHAGGDVVVANILAGTLIEHAAAIVAWGRAGAFFACSGILPDQAEEVAAAFAPWCEALERHERDGWIRLTGCILRAV